MQTLDRLPPPIFPPGSGTWQARSAPRPRGPVAAAVGGAEIQLHAPEPPVASDDPHLSELIRMVEALAAALRGRGEAALDPTPGMPPFEVALRAYCVGFLSAARERGAA